MQQETKIDIRKMESGDLHNWVKSQNLPAFRAQQILQWLWQKGVQSFDEMTNLSKSLRELLNQSFDLLPISEDKVQQSQDGTIKTRWKLHDHHKIESVLIPVRLDQRYTACVSSQVGCSLTCSFCATGKMARIRNLDASEIFDQVIKVNAQSLKYYEHPLTNVVYMGMGEPLLNYTQVMKSIDLLTSPQGLGMAARRITLSTAGIAKMIKRLADDQTRVNLALSLHAADDPKRNEIMPINQQNNLDSLMEALNYFHQKARGKITYEYIALHEFNDSLEDAKNLARLCRDFPVKVNIIEYNRIDGFEGVKSKKNQLDQFVSYLEKKQVSVTVRRSRGKDIDAACGQLANKE